MQDSNPNLTTKIALTGLSHYLDSNNIQNIIATSALAMYLDVNCISKNKMIAQIALAIHLQNYPNETFSAINNFAMPTNTSAWANKILLMRQLPIRK
jgi:hypothetical protein